METSTGFWFMVYYQYVLVGVVVLALILGAFILVSTYLEKRSPRLFIGLMALLLLPLMGRAVADIVHSAKTGHWDFITVLKPIAYAFWGFRLWERGQAALQRSASAGRTPAA